MKVSVHHHVGLRVADIERSASFYIDALGGHWETAPMLYEGPDAEMIMCGMHGTRFQVCHIGFHEGVIELFEVLHPVAETRAAPTAGVPSVGWSAGRVPPDAGQSARRASYNWMTTPRGQSVSPGSPLAHKTCVMR